MGMQVSITINFSHEYSPLDVLKIILNNGWDYHFENRVTYLSSNDIDDYNWQEIELNTFNVKSFMNSDDFMSKIGLVIVYNNESGGEVVIYPGFLIFSLSINRKYLISKKIPDFNWYLNRMADFLECIKYTSIECEAIT